MTVMEIWTRTSERIEDRARTVTPRQIVFTLVAIIPFVIGFVSFMLWKIVWTAVIWAWSATVEGWRLAEEIISAEVSREPG